MGIAENEKEEVRRCLRFNTENMPCNASPEDGIFNAHHHHRTGLTAKLKCPESISRLKVEKIEGGLMVAGVVIAANCQIALPIFGFLFVLVGAVLTAISYRGPREDEDAYSYENRIALTGNARVLGPICIVFGALMILFGAFLCALTRRARKRARRIGFHCPIHGDFYPNSPLEPKEILSKNEDGRSKLRSILCLGSKGSKSKDNFDSRIEFPQCPHSMISSTRSSISSGPLSPCPQPMPFLVNSGIVSSGIVQTSAGTNLPNETFGSIRSLSVSREVASFPLSRTPTPTTHHRQLNDPLMEDAVEDSPTRPELRLVAPIHRTDSKKYNEDGRSSKRKSVSILLDESRRSSVD